MTIQLKKVKKLLNKLSFLLLSFLLPSASCLLALVSYNFVLSIVLDGALVS